MFVARLLGVLKRIKERLLRKAWTVAAVAVTAIATAVVLILAFADLARRKREEGKGR